MKKVVKEAMKKAKEIEKIPTPSREEVLELYKAGLKSAEKLNKLLKPQWFISDVHKKVLPSKKKKTL